MIGAWQQKSSPQKTAGLHHLARENRCATARARGGTAGEISVDKRDFVRLLSRMAQSAEKQTTPVSLVIDAVLVIAFFAFMSGILRPHVPSNDPKMITLWAALAASCISGVFWLCIQMFRVVLKGQRAARK